MKNVIEIPKTIPDVQQALRSVFGKFFTSPHASIDKAFERRDCAALKLAVDT